MTDIRPFIEKAIARFGSEVKLARAAGVAQSSINEAKRGNVGPRVAIAIERATEGEITRAQLRPDLFT